MADSQEGKKRKDTAAPSKGSKKRKYLPTAKGPSAAVPSNTRGFLVSCLQGKESKAAFEAVDLLKEFYDRSKGQQPQPAAAPPAEAGDGSKPVNGSSGAASDIAARLAEEVAELRDPAKKLFTWHNLNLPGLVYISMAPAEGPGPVELVTAIAEEIVQTKTPRTFLCLRVIPVEAVCHASLEAIQKAAAPLVARSFRPASPGGGGTSTAPASVAAKDAGTGAAAPTAAGEKADGGASANAPAAETLAAGGKADGAAGSSAAAGEKANGSASANAADPASTEAPLTFSVLYEHRASPPLQRLAVINAVVDLIPKGTNKVDLGNPAKTVIVQLLKGSAMLAVVAGYPRLNKLNFRALRGEGGADGEKSGKDRPGKEKSGKDRPGKEKGGGKGAGHGKGGADGKSQGTGQNGMGAGAAVGGGCEGEPGPGPGSTEPSGGGAGGSGAGTAPKGDPDGAGSALPTANGEERPGLMSSAAEQRGSGERVAQGDQQGVGGLEGGPADVAAARNQEGSGAGTAEGAGPRRQEQARSGPQGNLGP